MSVYPGLERLESRTLLSGGTTIESPQSTPAPQGVINLPRISKAARSSARASVRYLADVMDQYHSAFGVYEDVSSAGNHFHA